MAVRLLSLVIAAPGDGRAPGGGVG